MEYMYIYIFTAINNHTTVISLIRYLSLGTYILDFSTVLVFGVY